MIDGYYVYASLVRPWLEGTHGRCVWGPRIMMTVWARFRRAGRDPMPALAANVWFRTEEVL